MLTLYQLLFHMIVRIKYNAVMNHCDNFEETNCTLRSQNVKVLAKVHHLELGIKASSGTTEIAMTPKMADSLLWVPEHLHAVFSTHTFKDASSHG